MEIRATPARGRRRRALRRALAAAGVLALLGLLSPALFGLSPHVVADRAMGDNVPHGALAYSGAVPIEELAPGDVVTFMRPNDDEPTWVTRRIVSVRDEGLVTRGDDRATVDPWVVPLDAEPARLSFFIPWLGLPGLVAGPMVWATVLVVLLASATVLLRLRRRGPDPGSNGAPAQPERSSQSTSTLW